MAVFSYQAADENNRVTQGTIHGESPAIARRMLRERGLHILSIEAVSQTPTNADLQRIGMEASGLSDVDAGSTESKPQRISIRSPAVSWPWRRKHSQATIANFLSELATLLTVGVPLIEALDTLISQSPKRLATRLMQIRDVIESGVTLRDAMAQHPDLFDELSLSLVEVGENTGHLDESLRCLADFKRRSVEFKDRVGNALLYPVIILVMAIGVSIFLMTVVVPSLLENLADLGKELPWPTRVLKSLSDGLLTHGWWLAIIGLAGLLGLGWGLRTQTGRRIRDEIVFRLPLIGMLSRKQEISKVSLVVATLISSGLDLLKALEIASRTSHNTLLREALEIIAERIRSGKELGEAMQRIKYFPPLVSQVFSVGQKSGRLEEMLFQLSSDYDKQVTTLSNRLAVVVEPLLIVVLSIIVGFILFATLLPILEAGNVL